MPKWLAARELDAFEYSFGRGIRLGTEGAKAIGAEAEKYGIQMSVHMPYFINLATEEDEKKIKNIGYFADSLKVAEALGAKRAVFHPGSASGGDRGAILQRAKGFFKEIIATLDDMGLMGKVTLCAETMGKINQLGSLDEVIELCNVDERIWPAIDFGHLHCRGLGAINGREDYAAILDRLESGVGTERTRTMHVHFSRIEYTKGGEKMHHTFADVQYGPEFMPLAELVAERGYEPVFICESKGTMAEDAKSMKDMYFSAINSLLK
ncbi:MAG: TIM barrel protein [Clostridia bacterium]|nr:TIM barrel protein [Clostridia bacterium]MBQ4611025.1 TIM barrel protein [Clostridia bacterium]MBQ6704223.1 TIM barrel protein [Clostridia bacterium]